jgi:hypothetical protein
MNTPELRKTAQALGLTVTTPVKKKKTRRYKTDKELLTEILRTPQIIRQAKENAKLRQLQNMIRQANKHMKPKKNTGSRMNNYDKKRMNIINNFKT